MNNADRTAAFFAAISPATKESILSAIAKHYSISTDKALAEVTDDHQCADAEEGDGAGRTIPLRMELYGHFLSLIGPQTCFDLGQ